MLGRRRRRWWGLTAVELLLVVALAALVSFVVGPLTVRTWARRSAERCAALARVLDAELLKEPCGAASPWCAFDRTSSVLAAHREPNVRTSAAWPSCRDTSPSSPNPNCAFTQGSSPDAGAPCQVVLVPGRDGTVLVGQRDLEGTLRTHRIQL